MTRKKITQSEKPVVEDLAQHYTMLVTKRIAGQVRNALKAYQVLLKCQPEAIKARFLWRCFLARADAFYTGADAKERSWRITLHVRRGTAKEALSASNV